ncbi:MAG: phospho-N-acetylmuramoyl-pentapeptide-transferase [Planctomycetota bacterium]
MLFYLLDLLRSWFDGSWLYGFPFSLLDQVEFRALFAAMGAFVFVVVAGKPVIAALRRAKIGDIGTTDAGALQEFATSKKNTPTMGGVLICGSILLWSLLLADLREQIVVLGVLVLVWLTILGGVDDWLKLTIARREGGRQGLMAWEKLVFQLGLGLLVGFFGYRMGVGVPLDGATQPDPSMWHVLNLPFQRTFEPGTGFAETGLIFLPMAAYVVIAMLLLPGMSNAVNLTDGMDGLAGGIAAAVSFGLMLLALVAGDEGLAQYFLVPYVPPADELGVIAGAMAGACLGFLWWNCNPAQVFMGDTGSLALGGLIAYIAIMIRQEAVMVLMCGVFVLEMVSVIMQVGYYKMTGGRRIFRMAPYHHHLQMGGWPESRIVGRLWIVSILLTIVAVASLKVR